MKIIKTKLVVLSLSILSSFTMLTSCVNNDDISITEPNRYTNEDIKSYSDLFDVFWTTMDQQYNYFYEQKRRDGMDWSNIYKEYSPKFKALKTFGRSTDDDKEINEEYLKAKQYFTEIIDPIIDRHFGLHIMFPTTSNNSNAWEHFKGDMLNGEKINTLPFNSKYDFMKTKLNTSSLDLENFTLAGYLNSNPDIYYFTFQEFELAEKFKISLLNKYLSPNKGNAYLLSIQDIENSKELNSIQDPKLRKKARDITVNILNEWNDFFVSTEVNTFNEEVAKFNSTEVVSERFVNASESVLNKVHSLVDFLNPETYSSFLNEEVSSYINWFSDKIHKHSYEAYQMGEFENAATSVIENQDFYRKFLNPLHNGDIKKIIIDLRNNGGGYVIDARFFSDRFITKNEVFSYQRTKEGNGRFNYTPWVEVKTNPHKFGIPANIPIVLLTDKNSASMSEITTLMIKSQGNHVVSIGDYTNGATAGLGTTDNFNGGIRGFAGNRLYFYMPLMAMKDPNGQVIEGIGVKSDIYVAPPTNEELQNIQSSPATFVDRTLNEAIKYLSSK